MTHEQMIAYAIKLGVKLCEMRTSGAFTLDELCDELADLDLVSGARFEPWEDEVVRQGPFTRKAGTLNHLCLVPGYVR